MICGDIIILPNLNQKRCRIIKNIIKFAPAKKDKRGVFFETYIK
jgi:hypothetical protein